MEATRSSTPPREESCPGQHVVSVYGKKQSFVVQKSLRFQCCLSLQCNLDWHRSLINVVSATTIYKQLLSFRDSANMSMDLIFKSHTNPVKEDLGFPKGQIPKIWSLSEFSSPCWSYSKDWYVLTLKHGEGGTHREKNFNTIWKQSENSVYKMNQITFTYIQEKVRQSQKERMEVNHNI